MDNRITAFLLMIWVGLPVAIGVETSTIAQVFVIIDALVSISKAPVKRNPTDPDTDTQSTLRSRSM